MLQLLRYTELLLYLPSKFCRKIIYCKSMYSMLMMKAFKSNFFASTSNVPMQLVILTAQPLFWFGQESKPIAP